MVRANTVVLLSVASSLIAGCATRAPLDVEDLPPTAAGTISEHIIDNSDVAFYTTGEWKTSTSSSGYEGQNYLAAPSGSGNSVATWNLNIIKLFDVYAKWTAHPNRGSNVKYVIHHLDARNNLVTDTVTINQRENGGEWFKLGTYRMSALTGRVTMSDEADGYVIADAILFREIDESVASETADTDGDGLPDEWERQYGLDPNDPSDASLDADGDGLTNKDEFLLLTDPTNSDTDQDGMPDGYETDYGLDPTVDDAGGDLDGDGVSNYNEYTAGSAPNDENSVPSAIAVVLTWETPTQRTDGTPLTEGEIAQYEIVYQQAISSEEIVIDNESSAFVSYGGGSESNSVIGYQGSNYFTMPAGSGEMLGEWSSNNLSAGVQYEIHANWTSHPNRASNAKYQYTFTDNSGSQVTETVTVDQRENGGSWQQLGSFEAADSALTVSISNNADGYVIADAIRVQEAPPVQESIIIDADGQNRYEIRDLAPGEWEFQVRAIDSSGLQSELSDVAVKTIE